MTKTELEQQFPQSQRRCRIFGIDHAPKKDMTIVAMYESWNDGADWDVVLELKEEFSKYPGLVKGTLRQYGYK